MTTQVVVGNSTVKVTANKMDGYIANYLNATKQTLEKTDFTAQHKATMLMKQTTMLLFDLLDNCAGDVNVDYTKETYPNIGTQDYYVHGYSTTLDVYIDIYITD